MADLKDLQKVPTLDSDVATLQSDLATLQGDVADIVDGTTAIEKANKDGSGNVIVNTYATITALGTTNTNVSNLLNGTTKVAKAILADTATSATTAGSATSAGKATNDGDGNAITTTYLKATLKGANNGLATLDNVGKVPSSQLPSYVDDVLEYANKDVFPAGEGGKIYVALDSNKTYRWSGSEYVEISKSLVIGTIVGTAYDGKAGNDLNNYVDAIVQGNVNVESAIWADNALYATNDIDGNAIKTTYVKKGSDNWSKELLFEGVNMGGDIVMTTTDKDATLKASNEVEIVVQFSSTRERTSIRMLRDASFPFFGNPSDTWKHKTAIVKNDGTFGVFKFEYYLESSDNKIKIHDTVANNIYKVSFYAIKHG